MTGAYKIIRGLSAPDKSVKTVFLAYGLELLAVTGEDLVRVGLMPDVSHKLVIRCVKNIVNGNGKLNCRQP